MIESVRVEPKSAPVTDGEIAVNNLGSARRNAWSRLRREPQHLHVAEYLVVLESFAAQFLGDLSALDRLEILPDCVDERESDPAGIALLRAQVAATLHRFAEARVYLADRKFEGELHIPASRLSLSIDQACGDRLDSVLESRRQQARRSQRLEDYVPLGALLADLGCCDEAEQTYERALREYNDVSPFAPAWVCFQLGILRGEVAPHSNPRPAAGWYRKAIEYLPGYVKARVHLAEIHLSLGDASAAESLLRPVTSSSDPEVHWRLADVLAATGRTAEAEGRMEAARSGFETLLSKHPLAFADHGAEFYSGSGRDPARAFELARVNLANRPTLRAFEQAYGTAVAARRVGPASEILRAARHRWGGTFAFGFSSLAAVTCTAA
jgi:tetratricopeptide (TPR) repeat protein